MRFSDVDNLQFSTYKCKKYFEEKRCTVLGTILKTGLKGKYEAGKQGGKEKFYFSQETK